MEFRYRPTKDPKSCRFLLALPGHEVIHELNSVISASFKGEFIKVSEVSMEVMKYIYDEEKGLVMSNGYDDIDVMMEVLIPEIGWFRINEPPSITIVDDENETKSFTLSSYETQLMDKDLKSLYINLGTVDSYEMFEENKSQLGLPMKLIQIYDKENPKFSLMDYVLADTIWKVGHIDTEIALMQRSFEIDNKDVYSFLMNDLANAVRGLVLFNTLTNEVNIYRVEKYGEDTGVYFSKRNLINELNISPYINDVYTQFEVSGGEDLNITGFNFGSNYIQNINYFLDMFPEEFQEKYEAYLARREELRQQYIEQYTTYVRKLEIQQELINRVPADDVENNWRNYEDPELEAELNAYRALVEELESIYTVDGVFNIEGYPDAALYNSYKNVVIPDIEAEIEFRKGSHSSTEKADKVDYERMYDLYGLTELKVLLEAAKNRRDTLAEAGYSGTYEDSNLVSPDTFSKHHAEWEQACKDISNIEAAIKERQAQVDACQVDMDAAIKKMSEIGQEAQIDAKAEDGDSYLYGFTEKELLRYNVLIRSTDYQDNNIALTSLDTALSRIDLEKQLYQSGVDELEIESQPQLEFSIDSDRIFAIPEFRPVHDKIQLGNFMYVEISKRNVMKLRLQSLSLNLLDLSKKFSIEFSNVTYSKGIYNDYNNLLESALTSSKNSISKTLSNYINSTFSSMGGTFSASLMRPLLQMIRTQVQGAVFGSGAGGLTMGDLNAAMGSFDFLKVGELEAELAKVEHLDADSAFVKYLESLYVDASVGVFDDLKARVAQIDDLLSGNFSAELGHIIHLTAETVSIDEAVIKELIAAQIMVNDLQAGDITLSDKMRILSENGMMVMNGQTLQILGKDADGQPYVAIQLGYDANENPSLIIRDSTGSVMLDGQGLHEGIVPDSFIKADMIAPSQIDKSHLNFNIAEADENGNIDAGKVVVDGHGIDVEFKSVRESIENLGASIQSVSLTGQQVFVEDEAGTITPESITITANPVGGFEVGKWYIDDIEHAEYLAEDRMSITIPAEYMKNKKAITIKVVGKNTQIYDVISVYRVQDGQEGISVLITSAGGNVFKDDGKTTTTTLLCTVYRGAKQITPKSYAWYEFGVDDWVDLHKSTQSLTVNVPRGTARKRYKCAVDI